MTHLILDDDRWPRHDSAVEWYTDPSVLENEKRKFFLGRAACGPSREQVVEERALLHGSHSYDPSSCAQRDGLSRVLERVLHRAGPLLKGLRRRAFHCCIRWTYALDAVVIPPTSTASRVPNMRRFA